MSVPDLVSIIIPAWKATWFETALQSALHQDYPACEIIIGDDSKNDNIARIVDKLRPASRWPVFYQRNTPSLGEMGNTTTCLARARGKYIKFLHDDDVLKPCCVSKLVQAINCHPDIVMATSHRELVDVQGNPLPDHQGTAPLFNRDSVLHGQDVINFQAEKPLNFIGEPSSVLIRTDILRALMEEGEPISALGGEPMHFLADLAIYLKVLRFGHLAMVSQTLSQYRISRSQTLSTAKENADLVYTTHKKMPLMIKKLGWYNPTTEKGHIRVAPLSHPWQFSEHNLLQVANVALATSRLEMWLAERKLRPAQQKLARDYFVAEAASSHCTFYIDARNGDRNAWARTQRSLDLTVAGLSWQVIALVDKQVNYLPAGTEQLRLDLTDGLTALNEKNRELSSDWLLFLDAGCQLLPSGLNALSIALSQARQSNAIYTDIIYLVDDKPTGRLFRPDFNLDFLLSCPGQMSRRWLFRREWVIAAGGFNPARPQEFEFELQLRLIESADADTIGHLSEPLVQEAQSPEPCSAEQSLLLEHLHRRGFADAEVHPTPHGPWRLTYHHQSMPAVTIVVLAREPVSARRCVMALLETTRYANYELLIVAEKEIGLEDLVSLAPERIKVLHFPAPWQRAGMANMAILQAQGDYLLFLNSDIQVMDTGWLENMLNHAQRPEVAIVGAKQLYANNLIRHAGYILGMNGSVAGEPFYGINDSYSGYMARLHADQNYSAVSGDFMLVRKEICFAVNGFDADLSCYDDIDFCLRVGELGGLTVWTPYARGCRQPQTNIHEITPAQRETEENIMFERWLPLISQDPAYNANLSLANPFMLQPDSQQSWQPLCWRPLPVVMPVTSAQSRESAYRIATPFTALRDAGFIEGKLNKSLPTLPEVAGYNPDVIIIEQQNGTALHRWMNKLSRFNQTFKIAEINAHLPADLHSHTELAAFQDNFIASVRRNLAYVDRLIVADEQQAELFADAHSEIIIVPAYLPQASWGQQCSLRNQGKKPRIGLPGSLCHGSMLEIITDLVKTFANDVEWVVYGSCPPALLSLISALHRETDTEIYHQELALMHLDLALVPHDGYPLSHAQAYFHLLEYGASGIPIVCSNSPDPGSSPLTVTRVPNQFVHWHDAIGAHLADPDASEKMGKALQGEVRQHWLLDDARLAMWSKAWQSK